MIQNYILLAITGALSIFGIVTWIKGGNMRRPFLTILAIILFIIVMVATIKGMDYMSFKTMIEQRFM